ncbi:hypothetical protein IAT38_001797 [Cryptococcus sp. DSM 104549]
MDVLDLVNDHNHVGAGHNAQARPYTCSFGSCDKAFARKSDLARHFKIHTNERAFACTYRNCGKSFIQRSALTVHYRVHTGERPHHCETCNKAFADSSSLARHRRIHTGKRPYTCHAPGCAKPFARRNTLLKHFKRQHPDLPPPSTSSQRPSIHVAVPSAGSRASSNSYLSGGSVGPNGEYYASTPSSAGPPHGLAAPHPSEGAAYSFSGGFTAQQQVLGGAPGAQYIFPGAGAIRPHFHQSPAPPGPGAVGLTPISTTGPHFAHAGSQTPSSPGDGRPHHGAGQVGDGLSPGPGSAHPHGLGPAQYPSPLSAYPHTGGYQLARFPSEGGGAIYLDRPGMTVQPRSVSAPGTGEAPKFQPYMMNGAGAGGAQWSGGVGGGFHASQLAMPAQHAQQHGQHLGAPYQPQHMQRSVSASVMGSGAGRSGRMPHSPAGSASDDDPDEPLVALTDAPPPTFAIHPPQGPAMSMSMPLSAVEGSSHFHQIPHAHTGHGGSQVLYSNQHNQAQQQGRLHSAPPTMARFNSMPAVPTMSSWGQIQPFQEGQGHAHSAGSAQSAGAPSAKSADEEWEELEKEMISREASVGEDVEMGAQGKKDAGEGEGVTGNVFSSSASSASTSSTLVGSVPPSNTLPPISVFAAQGHPQGPHSAHPMALTPLNPNGFYPTPMTPAHEWAHEGITPTAMLGRGGYLPSYPGQEPNAHSHYQQQQMHAHTQHQQQMHAHTQHQQQMHQHHQHQQHQQQMQREKENDSEHDITLTTPPKGWTERKESHSVTAVGLGIANVHFGNGGEITKGFDSAEEEEDELDEDEEELESEEGGQEDDSDDEFVLGRKPRKGKKGAAKKKGRTSAASSAARRRGRA